MDGWMDGWMVAWLVGWMNFGIFLHVHHLAAECQKGSQQPGHLVRSKDTGAGCVKISRLQFAFPKYSCSRSAINAIDLINFLVCHVY